MSSTGIVRPNIFLPTTSLGEESRQLHNTTSSLPNHNDTEKKILGFIIEVHSEKPWIKALSNENNYIAGNEWIPLAHSSLEIIERFGSVRKGMKVSIAYTGIGEVNALATIIGVEGESFADKVRLENKVAKSVYAIYTPGST